MAKTFVTVLGSGQISRTASQGSSTLRFNFADRENASAAVGEVTGFIDALLSDIDLEEAGLLELPVASTVHIVEHDIDSVSAFFDLSIVFYFGAAVEEWLESFGIVDDDLVTVSVGPVDWAWDEDGLDEATIFARVEAVQDARLKADDYGLALDVTAEPSTPKLVLIDELSVDVELPCMCPVFNFLDQLEAVTVGEALTPSAEFSVTVEIEATFSIRY